jgi:hypothetical protein
MPRVVECEFDERTKKAAKLETKRISSRQAKEHLHSRRKNSGCGGTSL